MENDKLNFTPYGATEEQGSVLSLLSFSSAGDPVTGTARIQESGHFPGGRERPILMFYSGADIWQLEEEGIREVALEETEHYAVTKAFMNDREGMLRELLGED
ncbi:hypothetical protein G5B47_14665 [Paenibacillus sp. 7124]|uniref:Uncharacterized protein n=1 Tax=Paenibacillus apii TaxID=1850370 RepID=A0A6M1PTS9_9BACL|nr:hypothetical protein [Paenibacillus apii]NGM83661.1 hypothetical protein [Paenibacillus apii]NJJ41233.1 hypothetical protein [Paenibacillus apii]